MPPRRQSQDIGASSNALITAPAIGLIVAGVLKLFSALKFLFFFTVGDQMMHSFFPFSHLNFPPDWSGFYGVGAMLFIALPAGLIIFGGFEMLRLRSYAWAMAAAIIAIMACSLLGLPVGIWALIILLQTGVREKFSNAPVAISSIKWLAAGFFLITVLCFSALALGSPLQIFRPGINFSARHRRARDRLSVAQCSDRQPRQPLRLRRTATHPTDRAIRPFAPARFRL